MTEQTVTIPESLVQEYEHSIATLRQDHEEKVKYLQGRVKYLEGQLHAWRDALETVVATVSS